LLFKGIAFNFHNNFILIKDTRGLFMYKGSDNHTRYYNKNNIEVPSVTTILKILNKPGLVYWANYLGFKHLKVDDELEYTSYIGTRVHTIINSIMLNRYIILTENTDVLLNIKKSLTNFRLWYNNNEIEPIFMEKSFFSEKFGGTLDFYGKINNEFCIVDYKTSKDIYPTMFIQLALYYILLKEYNYHVDKVGIVLTGYKSKLKTKFINIHELTPYIEIGVLLVDLFEKYYNLNGGEI
jgi:hypothetical protein